MHIQTEYKEIDSNFTHSLSEILNLKRGFRNYKSSVPSEEKTSQKSNRHKIIKHK